MVEAIRSLADRAGQAGVKVSLEVVNRYETNVVNTAAQMLELLDETGTNLAVHLDTYHMNIEEDGFVKPVEQCAGPAGLRPHRGVPPWLPRHRHDRLRRVLRCPGHVRVRRTDHVRELQLGRRPPRAEQPAGRVAQPVGRRRRPRAARVRVHGEAAGAGGGPVSAGFLGIDLGTSGLKLTLVAEDGLVLAESEASYGVETPQPGFAETHPDDWMAALRDAAARLPAGEGLLAIGVTGQMHGLVLAGEDGRPAGPAVLWPDQRASSVLSSWPTLPGDARARLANPVFAGMAGPMLTWLRQNEPAQLDAAALVRSPKDWLRAQLTGDRVTERSDASATLLWDVTTDDWSTAATAAAGVRGDQLPEVVASDTVVGKATWPPVDDVQVQEHSTVSVVAGGADTACALAALQASGLAANGSDSVVVNVGTGVQILRPGVTATPRESPVSHLYADAAGGWYEMLAVQNGGLALSWCQDLLGLDWDTFVASAATARPGSAGLSFVPFLTGERGGLAGPDSRAGWLGGTRSTGRAELARAAFEALAFTVRRGIELLGAESSDVVLSGGGARDRWVRQLIADVLGRPVSYVSLRSASGVGAAVLAARAVGVDLTVCAEVVAVTVSPSPALEDAYERWNRAVEAMAVFAG